MGRAPCQVRTAMHAFLEADVNWYFRLASALTDHSRVSLSGITVPTAFVAGHYDILAGHREMETASERIPGATYVKLPSSHFASLEHPARVHEELLAFVACARP